MNENEKQKQLNEQFYQELVSNLYITESGDVLRANDINEALRIANSEKYKQKGTGYQLIEKYELGHDQTTNLFQAASLLQIISSFEDGSDLGNEILYSTGDYLFALKNVEQSVINKTNSIEILIKMLEDIKEKWDDNFALVQFLVEEMKEKKSKVA